LFGKKISFSLGGGGGRAEKARRGQDSVFLEHNWTMTPGPEGVKEEEALRRALPTEIKVECGTSQNPSGTSVNLT
jgi:hypothetical protein